MAKVEQRLEAMEVEGWKRMRYMRWARRGFPGEEGDNGRNIRVKYSVMVTMTIAMFCGMFFWHNLADAGISGPVTEIPVSVKAGDQNGVSVSGTSVAFVDRGTAAGASLSIFDLTGGTTNVLPLPAGIAVGPDSDSGSFVWQDASLQACLGTISGDSRCQALPLASAMALSGDKALTSHDGKIIRLVNFDTMRSRILDSSTSSGGRYDPAIDGGQGVWVRERGYAGQYYEPLIVTYDLLTDTLTHVTRMGGGATPAGESIYERRHPTVDSGRIFYQQRQRGPQNQWDIHEAVPASFGEAVVSAPGDQTHPAVSGNLLVYQDNRTGHLNEQGEWTGQWDIYLKDLVSGEEIAVCTAAGDQINPVIDGNLIVWEDNRNGDWDIFAAVIASSVEQPEPPAQPLLSLSAAPAYWRNYEDYLARQLTVPFRVTNSGAGAAGDLTLGAVVTTPGTVAIPDSLPAPVAHSVAPGTSADFELAFGLPPELTRFRTSLFMSCTDAAGGQIWFPAPPSLS